MYFVFAILFALQCASAEIKLECAYGMTSWILVKNVYQCDPKVVKVGRSTDSTIVEVSKSHLPGYSNEDVIALHIKNQPIDVIPKNIDSFFVNLELIHFENCPIRSFTKDDLKIFKELRYFLIQSGKLTTISGDAFKYSAKLQYIDLSFNKITDVGKGIFDHTPKLNTVYFWENLCINSHSHLNSILSVEDIARELDQNCPRNEFKDFQKKQGRKYKNDEHALAAEAHYKRNKKFIDEHNAKHKEGSVTFAVGENDFTDKNITEVIAQMCRTVVPTGMGAAIQGSYTLPPGEPSKDWRSIMQPVRNQGGCGSCWAFATVAQLEFLYKRNYPSYSYIMSPQYLIDCSRGANKGCDGGYPEVAMRKIF